MFPFFIYICFCSRSPALANLIWSANLAHPKALSTKTDTLILYAEATYCQFLPSSFQHSHCFSLSFVLPTWQAGECCSCQYYHWIIQGTLNPRQWLTTQHHGWYLPMPVSMPRAPSWGKLHQWHYYIFSLSGRLYVATWTLPCHQSIISPCVFSTCPELTSPSVTKRSV